MKQQRIEKGTCKISGRPALAAIPFTIGDRLRPVTIEAMRSIQPLHLTGAGSRFFRVQRFTSGPRQVNFFVRYHVVSEVSGVVEVSVR
jgi:hypothetical protein